MSAKLVKVITQGSNLAICSLLLGTSVYIIGALLLGILLACL